jgi:succinate-acetate transporter protein
MPARTHCFKSDPMSRMHCRRATLIPVFLSGTEDVVMNIKAPNPASLGLAGFALTTWLLSMINAGWFGGNAMGMVLAVAFAYGGTAQVLAGLMEIPRGNTFGATAFVSYGAFWWSLALFVLFLHGTVPAAFIGWYLFLWGVFTLYMWVATWRAARVLQLVFLSLWITFFVLAASEWTGLEWLHHAGGYLGMLTALLAFYLSAAEIINETHGHVVLPTGAATGPLAVSLTIQEELREA